MKIKRVTGPYYGYYGWNGYDNWEKPSEETEKSGEQERRTSQVLLKGVAQ